MTLKHPFFPFPPRDDSSRPGGTAAVRKPFQVDRAMPGSLAHVVKEQERMAQESREYVQQHYRETGYLPKEYEMLRATNPAFNRAELDARRKELAEAEERIKLRNTRQQFIEYSNRIMYEREARELRERARLWVQTWNRKAILNSLGGTLNNLLNSPNYGSVSRNIQDKKNYIRELETQVKVIENALGPATHDLNPNNPVVSKTTKQIKNKSKEELRTLLEHKKKGMTEEAMKLEMLMRDLARLGHENAQWNERVEAAIEDLLRHIEDPSILEEAASRRVRQFLTDFNATDVNLITKLSELITAKALWFRREGPVMLKPGPPAIKNSDSPGYVGIGVIGDNLRIAGIRPRHGELLLNPDPLSQQALIGPILNSIVNGIASKVTTYEKTWLGRGNKLIVTLDTTELPWVLQGDYLRQIRLRIAQKLAHSGQPITHFLHAVFFITGGQATRIWP